MKKSILLIPAFIFGLGITASADIQPQDLNFEPAGGGYYIYCNNPEAIGDEVIVNSDDPRYIMNNENLGPGTYYLYLSHFNYTGSGGLGYDIELDVELTSTSEDCIYTIINPAFETSELTSWYDGDIWTKYEGDWGMLHCCAKALNKPIYDIDGTTYYKPYQENEQNIVRGTSVSGKDTRWLSEFIANYSEVHFGQPVHIQGILKIESGSMNVNVCAFKSNGNIGDRSTMKKDAAYGIYRRDRTVKGIADTLPQVKAELEYTIDDTTEDGTYLPVTLYNQYAPDGNTVTEWFTNLNPLDDPWAKSLAAESDMLAFTYEDDNKLTYYGKNIPASERDNIWRLDTHHSDTTHYEAGFGTGAEADYSPNYYLDPNDKNEGHACNLGNYGVNQTYELKITNNGTKTRYFEYAPTTNSNIIVYTADKDGNFDYALTKTLLAEARQDVMSVVELPAGKTTEFSVNVILPVNYNGGTKNAFIIKDNAQKENIDSLKSKTDNRQYYSPISGKYLSEVEDELPDATLEKFKDNLGSYEIIRGKDNNLVRWCAWDGKFNYYYVNWSLCSDVYILDKDYNIIGSHKFDTLPWAASYADGKYYVQTARNGIWTSENGIDWEYDVTLKTVPKYEEPEPDVTFGEVLSNINNVDNTVSFPMGDYFADITDSEYSTLYNAVKDFRLETYENNRTPTAMNIGIKGIRDDRIEYNGKYYRLSDDDREFLDKQLYYLINFTDGTRRIRNKTISSHPMSQWAYDDIKTACLYGFVPSSLMRPSENRYQEDITRASFCSVAANMIRYTGTVSLPENPKYEFNDTTSEEIRALADLGIINGYEDGSFRPAGKITRQEAAVILSRLIGLYGLNEEIETSYDDADKIGDWAADAVNISARYGIMNGIGDNLFSPDGGYTVEQSIVTILRAFDTVTNAGMLKLPELPETEQKHYTVYREGYRNGRIELAMYDTDGSGELIRNGNELSVNGSYENDVKYYFSCGKWIEFEKGYERISNNALAVLAAY